MRFALLVAVLPLGNAIPQGPSGELEETTSNVNRDGPPYNKDWDGPPHSKDWDGPPHSKDWDGPPHSKDWDGPGSEPPGTTVAAEGIDNDKRPEQTKGASATPSVTKGDLKVTILADTNRDGKVDVTGETDLASKETWTVESGALFLANIGDTDGRCSSMIKNDKDKCVNGLEASFLKELHFVEPELWNTSSSDYKKGIYSPELELFMEEVEKLQGPLMAGEPMDDPDAEYQRKLKALDEFEEKLKEFDSLKSNVDEYIDGCHDASDNVLRNPTYLAPLRTLPNPGLGDSATGSIAVSDETAASKVRIFHKAGDGWRYVAANDTFAAQDVKAGLELGIDARDVRRPNGWDGRATVQFTVTDGAREARDSVALRVAPILAPHHGQAAEQLLTSAPQSMARYAAFASELDRVARESGMEKPMKVLDTVGCNGIDSSSRQPKPDIWAQDFFEAGYASMPGPAGPIGLHVMIRSAQETRQAGRKAFQALRSGTVGAVQHLANDGRYDYESESTGNLETMPPYTHNGESYPAGRVVMGSRNGTTRPRMLAFLEAQEVQAPIELDTSWLYLGHVDEFVQFVPVQSERGWAMVVDDPLAGLALFETAQRDGHGAVKAVSRPKSPTDPSYACHPVETIDQVLDNTDFASVQDRCGKAIERNVEIIKQKTGITDAEIVRVPALYYYKHKSRPHWTCDSPKGKDGKKPRKPGSAQVPKDMLFVALYPSAINNIVLNSTALLAPNPWGPVIGEQDILAAAVSAAYASIKYTVRHVDDWHSHHVLAGQVHCASNVIRAMTGKWWLEPMPSDKPDIE